MATDARNLHQHWYSNFNRMKYYHHYRMVKMMTDNQRTEGVINEGEMYF